MFVLDIYVQTHTTIGARPILKWRLHLMLDNEPAFERHPLNRKARCTFYLRDLQEQAGLSDDALQHIARVLGPRCVLGARVLCWGTR